LFYDYVKEGKDMQRLIVSLCGIFVCVNAFSGAYLPVVDVSQAGVSARAVFGEEIVPQQKNELVTVAPLPKTKPVRKIVSRSAKQNDVKKQIVSNDVLKPKKPSSDLWANNDAPLRMPRIDEISVVRSDALLPEESLNFTPTADIIARREQLSQAKALERETLTEINNLRQEIARLNAAQKQAEEKIAMARPMVEKQDTIMQQPTVKHTVVPERSVTMRREVVPIETKKDVVIRSVKKDTVAPKMVAVDDSMTKLSPNELKKAFKKTYLSENKHLSTYRDDRFDVASDMSSDIEGFSAQRDLSESSKDVRPLEVKITFFDNDAGLSRENYDMLSRTASIVVNNPKRAIQIAIPESVTYNKDSRKLAARRLAIVEQVLKDTGVAERRIVPVLSQRSDDVFVLRVISGEVFETLTEQKRNMFGDSVSKKTYKSMTW